ncbi:glycoside hydrolase N-terminal domain-containing protein [Micromonospora sp. HK10]|uniref:glycoside hydrolase N-terminal domain-containing protein n=1 Tax=Micromonospora sp. HK10 TaxID=1538294 RepID=UPI0012E24CB5
MACRQDLRRQRDVDVSVHIATSLRRRTVQNDAPADGFADCYLVGNRALGAAVHGRPDTGRLDLNLDTLWSGGPPPPALAATRDMWRRRGRGHRRRYRCPARDLRVRCRRGRPRRRRHEVRPRRGGGPGRAGTVTVVAPRRGLVPTPSRAHRPSSAR